MAGEDAHFYRTDGDDGLPHDPFNAIVGPRPIGWISTRSADGVDNLAPYSFFNGLNYRPPLIGFASVQWKDTVANIDATGLFAWNLATRDLAHAMNESSASIDADQDEFARSGLTPVDGRVLAVPRVLESPVNFECQLTQLIQLTDVTGTPLSTWFVVGQVIAVHIDPAYLVDGVYATAKPRPILRAGGPGDYAEITEAQMFTMIRPDDS